MVRLFAKLLLSFSLLLLSISSSHAENMQKLGGMNVHYMAIGATFLTPEIAKAYNIERSKYNGLVNISVLDNTKAGLPAKTVSITGSAKNLAGQRKNLSFTEVKEGDAIYYLAQVNYRDQETIVFDLTINDGNETQQLKFSQKFYTE
ncbi:DUF4426 domain-containing protein [Thalassotalea ganghwensis]